MGLTRDDDEERTARIDHILDKLATARRNTDRSKLEVRRVLDLIEKAQEKRKRAIAKLKAALNGSPHRRRNARTRS